MSPRTFSLLSVFLFSLAIFLRAAFSLCDLSMDEIWTYRLVQLIDSPFEIFTELTIDNNHPLNTFFFYLLGDVSYPELYRLLSLTGGIVALVFAFLISLKDSRQHALFILILIGISYPFVFYSSEARGYGPMMACGMIAFYILVQIHAKLETKQCLVSTKSCMIFWTISILGFLSQTVYAGFYSALFLWTCAALVFSHLPFSRAFKILLKIHLLPTLVFLALYIFFFRFLNTGGAPAFLNVSALYDSLAFTFGLPGGIGTTFDSLLPVVISLSVYILVCLAGIVITYTRNRPRAAFYLAATIVLPALLYFFNPTDYIRTRYFLLNLMAAMFAVTEVLFWISGRSITGKLIVTVILMLFVVGQVPHHIKFFKYGRGEYRETLRYILQSTDKKRIRIASDHDFRNRMIIDFHKKYIPGGNRITYHPEKNWKTVFPDFYLFHRFKKLKKIPQTVPVKGTDKNIVFHYRKVFFYGGGFSGWHWYVFERQ